MYTTIFGRENDGSAVGRWDGYELLVLTDGSGYRYQALALPFANATVVEVQPHPPTPSPAAQFDIVVADCAAPTVDALDALLDLACEAVRPDGRILMPIDPAPSGPSTVEATTDARRPAAEALSWQAPSWQAPSWKELSWDGITVLDGRVFAVLRNHATRRTTAPSGTCPGSGAASIFEVAAVVAAALAAQAGWSHATDGPARPRSLAEHARSQDLLRRALEDRRRSEHALLSHLEVLARELRKRSDGREQLRAVLTTSVAGRLLLRVLRQGRRIMRRR